MNHLSSSHESAKASKVYWSTGLSFVSDFGSLYRECRYYHRISSVPDARDHMVSERYLVVHAGHVLPRLKN
jgi:hypothetical protein